MTFAIGTPIGTPQKRSPPEFRIPQYLNAQWVDLLDGCLLVWPGFRLLARHALYLLTRSSTNHRPKGAPNELEEVDSSPLHGTSGHSRPGFGVLVGDPSGGRQRRKRQQPVRLRLRQWPRRQREPAGREPREPAGREQRRALR